MGTGLVCSLFSRENTATEELNSSVKKYIEISRRVYDTSRLKDHRRIIVFLVRALFHDRQMKELLQFFQETPVKRDLSAREPFLFEQVTRKFFYKDSTFKDRFGILKNHFDFVEEKFNAETIRQFYSSGVCLWKEENDAPGLSAWIKFESGQKKEGLLSLILKLEESTFYQIIFWFSPGPERKTPALWIGAIQGSNSENARALIRELTKRFYGYRTKNLVLFILRAVASSLGIESIYAVSDKGYYAQNHLRFDRKLKISLDDFWEETGGQRVGDGRFYQLPLTEERKSLEEIKSSKRNQYRKRFETLDELEKGIKEKLQSCLARSAKA